TVPIEHGIDTGEPVVVDGGNGRKARLLQSRKDRRRQREPGVVDVDDVGFESLGLRDHLFRCATVPWSAQQRTRRLESSVWILELDALDRMAGTLEQTTLGLDDRVLSSGLAVSGVD